MLTLAAIILVLFGGASLGLGMSEIMHPNLLPPLAARSTTGVGLILILLALFHFRAPHKSFLLSIPLLAYFNVQMYFDSLFYFGKPLWHYQGILAVISILALVLSYKGYRKSAEKIESAGLQT